MQTYMNSIGKFPLLSADAELALFQRIRMGDMEARSQMIEANLRLVIDIATKSRGWYVGLGMREDIVEEGNIGVIHATESFNPALFQTRFSTYATFWIRQHIRSFLISQGYPIKLPKRAHTLGVQWDRQAAHLEDLLGRKPYENEIAYSLKLSPAQVKMVQRLKLARGILRECELEGDWERDHLGAAEFSRLPIEQQELFEKVNVFIEDLTEKEREVINMKFGLNGYEVLDYREIGSRLGISHEWARKTAIRVVESFKVIGSLRDEDSE
jgi:RNA polymerase primary sigma factor